MIPRHLTRVLRSSARQYPVVSVTGPRQSGKTTLVQKTFPRHTYVSLENPEHRTLAIEDPQGFFGRFTGRVILDEVQRAPDLFSYIQGIVDRSDRTGQFILTGSQNFLLMQRISQSLAGRCAVLHLLPFSQAELGGRPIVDPANLGRLPRRRTKPPASTEGILWRMLLTGFYPRIHDKALPAQTWLANYYQTYLERDVRDLLNIGDIEAFGRFVRLCAGRCGQLLNLSGLAGDAGISHTTAQRWLSALEASFIVFLLRPYHRNFNKRLIKSPKLFFIDTGLLCYLLRIRTAEQLEVHASRGAVFESWVVSEVLKSYYHRGQPADIHFWRDSTGHEVDLIIDQGSRQVPIEVKSGQTVAKDFFRELDYWRQLAGQPDDPAAIVYGGDATYQRKQGAVISWQHWA